MKLSGITKKAAMVADGSWHYLAAPASSYATGSWLFLRLLGLCYLAAFLSLYLQLPGLNGSQGILPAEAFLQIVGKHTGLERFILVPSLAWLNCTDGFLLFLAAAGIVASLLSALGMFALPSLFICWLFYLSLISIGGDFYSFQWDSLLLEGGFVALFMAGKQNPPANAVIWPLRLLLFKLVFMSGAVKLLGGDSSWHDLTACSYHWETQPLPTPVSWYVWQLPLWLQKIAVIVALALELLAPWLMFGKAKFKLAAGLLICFLQVLIAFTGNYCFFNLLTVSLCCLLFDNDCLQKYIPRQLLPKELDLELSCSNAMVTAACVILLLLNGLSASENLLRFPIKIPLLGQVLNTLEHLRIVNNYGVFAVMTTKRFEIIVQGSNDGVSWQDYKFRCKPQELNRAPCVVAPLQPRLDWQMWFAALGSSEQNPWFANFLIRLLQGKKEVLALLANDPFAASGHPPRYLRAQLYQYHFTDAAARAATGNWWRRQYVGEYFPVFSLF